MPTKFRVVFCLWFTVMQHYDALPCLLVSPSCHAVRVVEHPHPPTCVACRHTRLRKKNRDVWLLAIVMISSDSEALKLDIPGGKRELGESSRDGAVRECREEGLEFFLFHFIFVLYDGH
jgi:hypothetical protein